MNRLNLRNLTNITVTVTDCNTVDMYQSGSGPDISVAVILIPIGVGKRPSLGLVSYICNCLYDDSNFE